MHRAANNAARIMRIIAAALFALHVKTLGLSLQRVTYAARSFCAIVVSSVSVSCRARVISRDFAVGIFYMNLLRKFSYCANTMEKYEILRARMLI